MTNKVIRNYRIAEQRRKQREREEHQRVLDENEDLSADNEKLRRRASKAEQEYFRILNDAKILPDEFTSRAVSMMVARMIESNLYREQLEPVVAEFMRRLMIRMDKHRGPGGIEVFLKNDDMQGAAYMTVTIPEMRITEILDDLYLETVAGGRGPVVMEDRPVLLQRGMGGWDRPMHPDDPVGMNRVETI